MFYCGNIDSKSRLNWSRVFNFWSARLPFTRSGLLQGAAFKTSKSATCEGKPVSSGLPFTFNHLRNILDEIKALVNYERIKTDSAQSSSNKCKN